MANKPFNQREHDLNDPKARSKVNELVAQTSLRLADYKSKYDADTRLFFKSHHVAFIEFEVKHNWTDGAFPFDTIHIPFRKQKYVNLDKPTIFVMFNSDLTQHLYLTSKTLRESPVTHKRAKNYGELEKFYTVAVEQIKFNDLVGFLNRFAAALESNEQRKTAA